MQTLLPKHFGHVPGSLWGFSLNGGPFVAFESGWTSVAVFNSRSV